MNLIELYGKEMVAVLVPLITWALNNLFKAKARLVWASPHQFTFLVQTPPPAVPQQQPPGVPLPAQAVKTQSLFVWNRGKDKATKVELVLNWKPMCFNIWPPRKFQEHLQQDGRFVLSFDSLAPNEVVGCELLAVTADIPAVTSVRCDECVAERITMQPRPLVSPVRRRVFSFLALAGLASVVYAIILLLQFLIVKTPLGR